MLQQRQHFDDVNILHLRNGFDNIFPARAHRFALKKASLSHISAQMLAQCLEMLLKG
jgi:hypothetical protein